MNVSEQQPASDKRSKCRCIRGTFAYNPGAVWKQAALATAGQSTAVQPKMRSAQHIMNTRLSHEECRPLNSTWLHLNLLLDANRLLVQSSAAMEKKDINSGLCLPLSEKRERGRSCDQSLRRPDCVCIFRARGNTVPAYLRFILISHIADNN